MPHVIGEPCIGVKDAACVTVCPVDCIHSADDETMYYIDPEECIDCGACLPVCAVEAIFTDDDSSPEQERFIEVNANFYKARFKG